MHPRPKLPIHKDSNGVNSDSRVITAQLGDRQLKEGELSARQAWNPQTIGESSMFS